MFTISGSVASHVDQGVSDPSPPNTGGVPNSTALHDSGEVALISVDRCMANLQLGKP